MTMRQDIAGVVNNDLLFTFTLTYKGAPLDLTGYTPTVVVKPSQSALDSAGTTYTTANGITVTMAKAGRLQLLIPRSATTLAGNTWYRLDLSNGVTVSTAMLGVLNLMAA